MCARGAAPKHDLERRCVLSHHCCTYCHIYGGSVRFGRKSPQTIRCSFTLSTSFTAAAALPTDWAAATAWRSHGSTQKSHVETRLVRNRPNSNSDCSVYAALQLRAVGCPRCMCWRGRACVAVVCLEESRQSQPRSVIQTVCKMGNDCWWDSAAGYEWKRLKVIMDSWLTWFISWNIGVIVPITLIHLQ